MKKIIIEQRTGDWMSYLEGHKEYWGCGSTMAQAVYDLVIHHSEIFNLQFEWKD